MKGFQSKVGTPKPKLNKVRSPISVRRNSLIKRFTTVNAGRRVAASYRNIPPYANPVRPAARRLAANKENVDAATQRGNIKVVVRVRPRSEKESAITNRNIVKSIDANMVVFDPEEEGADFFFHGVKQTGRNMLVKQKKNLKFAFDRVYGPEHENSEIFHETIEPIIDIVLGGFNCSVFAYGSTGAGKTYTMLGSPTNPGMTFLTVMELYNRLEQMKEEHETEIAVSYLEVYNEMVRDLLGASGFLNIREDPKGGVAVPGLTLHKPSDADQLMSMLAYGNSVRSQHPTDHNAESSRSHAVFQVIVTLRKKFVDLNSTYKSAKLVMVDLAGSERGTATGYKGQRFREGASINRSLLSLANCINALADGKQHIPYRDSKLTRILKDSLGGNCKTVMIANVSPTESSYDDTYNTLKYANRAKNIKCQVKKNVLSVNACVTQYAQVVEEMTQKIESLTHENELLKEKLAGISEIQIAQSASAVPSEEPSAHGGCPKIEATQLEMYKSLLEQKAKTEKTLMKMSVSNLQTNMKLLWKKRRLETLRKLSSLNANCFKTASKYGEQLDSCKMDLVRTEGLAFEAQHELQSRLEGLKSFESSIDASSSVSLPAHEYFELLKNQKVDSSESEDTDSGSPVLRERVLLQEDLIEKSVDCLAKTFMLLKHNNIPAPPSIEAGYKEVVEDLCENRVRWSTDSVVRDSAHPSSTQLKSIMKPTNNSLCDPDVDMAAPIKADETYDCEIPFVS